MPETSDYVERATERIMGLLDEHHAVVHPELEARIAEGSYSSSGENIDPHHVTTALRELFKAGQLAKHDEATRGGRVVTTYTKADVGRQKTKTETAARRKRLLMARYQGWSQGTQRHPQGLIGPAGEAAVRSAILESGALQPATAGAGEVSQLLGVSLPGPLDSAGYFVPLARGIPQAPITVIFEVKNLRSWIYPSSQELYQLLKKGVLLQTTVPTAPLTPILVCRRAHTTLFWMAKQLGFVVIDMGTQFAGDVDPDHLDEVRTELFFTDLRVGSGPSLRVHDRLTTTLPRLMPTNATAWQATTQDQPSANLITTIARTTSSSRRLKLVDQLRARTTARGLRGGW